VRTRKQALPLVAPVFYSLNTLYKSAGAIDQLFRLRRNKTDAPINIKACGIIAPSISGTCWAWATAKV
jgi:hypothetical protein